MGRPCRSAQLEAPCKALPEQLARQLERGVVQGAEQIEQRVKGQSEARCTEVADEAAETVVDCRVARQRGVDGDNRHEYTARHADAACVEDVVCDAFGSTAWKAAGGQEANAKEEKARL